MKEKITNILNRMRTAALSCGRNPDTIRLVAVSKTKTADAVKSAAETGQTIFGENYIQEARNKVETLSSLPISWHFIGHLQSNKAKYAVKMFDLIHTVDSLKLAKEINKQAEKIGKIQSVLLQVNTGMEATKSGAAGEDVMGLAKSASMLNNIKIKGLMTMPPFFDEPEKAAPFFSDLRKLSEKITKENIEGVSMDELSMGMTGDFETAIREGATLIRIGTAIFGKRS